MKDFIRILPLKIKLLVIFSLALIFMVVVLHLNLIHSQSQLKVELASQTHDTMEDEVLKRLSSEALRLASRVENFMATVHDIPRDLANVLVNNIQQENHKLSRHQINNLIRNTLWGHKNIHAVYADFEANQLDNLDDQFKNSNAIHSINSSGTFGVYWVRNAQEKVQQITDLQENTKYDSRKDEFGIREAHWYLCPKETLAPCTREPHLWEISEGNSELMTAITTPVLVDNKFVGIVGVDIHLDTLQTLAKQLSQSLYNGQSKITLLSEFNLVVGASHYQQHLSRPFKEFHPINAKKLTELHKKKESLWLHEGVYYLGYSINIKDSENTWSLLIELPEAVVLASTHALIDTLDESIAALMVGDILIAGMVIVFTLFVLMFFIKSIVQPLKELDDIVQNLASQDGDLTQNVRLNTHAELISLSKGFTRFIKKLRDMITQLKFLGDVAKGTALKAKEINKQSLQATRDQQGEIGNIVLAARELSQGSIEVSSVATEISHSAEKARETIVRSQQSLSGSVQAVEALTQDMGEASESISEVANRSKDINRILDVIRAIAEQTNLLALNAAIEAARAGEQGRGFAVVADEVRSLASKTQASTEEINTMIQGLESGVNQAVKVINTGNLKAQGAMEETRLSYQSLASVVTDITSIVDHIILVANKTELQSGVIGEIESKLERIGDAAKVLATLANESDVFSDEMEEQMNTLDTRLASLKTY